MGINCKTNYYLKNVRSIIHGGAARSFAAHEASGKGGVQRHPKKIDRDNTDLRWSIQISRPIDLELSGVKTHDLSRDVVKEPVGMSPNHEKH